MLRIGTTVIGVNDLGRAIEFWTHALGYVLRADQATDDGDFTVLVPAEGPGASLALQVSTSPVEAHPRLHLDLYADDPEAEIERLVTLGATRVDWPLYPEHPDFTVLADPDGNRFCIIDKSAD